MVPEAGAADDPLMAPFAAPFTSFQWHSYEAVPPAGSEVLARSARCLQAYRLAGLPAWGIQFHAEVTASNLEHWIRNYGSDPDAVAIGLDPDALLGESRRAIEAWNEVGRGVCERFLDAAAG